MRKTRRGWGLPMAAAPLFDDRRPEAIPTDVPVLVPIDVSWAGPETRVASYARKGRRVSAHLRRRGRGA